MYIKFVELCRRRKLAEKEKKKNPNWINRQLLIDRLRKLHARMQEGSKHL